MVRPQKFNVLLCYEYHFINKEEFDAIQAGRVNPFKDEIILPHPTTLGYNNPGLGHIDVGTPNNGWGRR